MKWVLWCLGIFAFFIPILTALLESNNGNPTSRAPYPTKIMKFIFITGIVLLIIAIYLTV